MDGGHSSGEEAVSQSIGGLKAAVGAGSVRVVCSPYRSCWLFFIQPGRVSSVPCRKLCPSDDDDNDDIAIRLFTCVSAT